MRINSIMYHDVVRSGDFASSGFAGAHADIYKLDATLFEEHLKTLATDGIESLNVGQIDEDKLARTVAITFDDGGESAYTVAADILEKYGFHGHFFIATDFIDTDTFLKTRQIRELHARGHIIGSHSASHPTRMAYCTEEEMRREWRTSTEKLADITGGAGTVASVPGGYFSRQVAETAAECGIRILFNSEPVTKVYDVNGCSVLGRFTIKQDTPAETVRRIASGNMSYRLGQFAFWNTNKAAKSLGGELYLSLTRKYLAK